MKYALAALGLFVSSAFAVEPRVSGADCYSVAHGKGWHGSTGGPDSGAAGLEDLCHNDVKNTGNNNPWDHASCVAAAPSTSIWQVTYGLACAQPQNNYNASQTAHLKFDVYASIVGSCAYNKRDACPITQQNFVDFIYGQIGKTANPAWPDISRVNGWWNDLVKWTATGSTIPYNNFDDFLHYGN